MVFPAEEWQRAAPEAQGLDSHRLNDALAHFRAHSGGAGTDEMALVRNGYLIWQGPRVDAVHEIYSCTKTFTSTLLGLLVTDGVLAVDDLAVKHLPSLDDNCPEYGRVQLSHLASMSSGYSCPGGDGWAFYATDRARHQACVVQYTVPGPPDFVAGTSFRYYDPQVHLLGYILTKVAGAPLEQVFRTRVAEPIGMRHFAWSDYGERDGLVFNNPAGTPGENQGGIRSSALDLARYGLLYLNQGTWNGKRILDPAFVARATTNQVPADTKTQHFDLTGRYGFYWWTNGQRADGTRPWPSAPPGTYAAHGAGRNFIFAIPEWRMVIVRLSPAPGGDVRRGGMQETVWEGFFARLGKSIRRRP